MTITEFRKIASEYGLDHAEYVLEQTKPRVSNRTAEKLQAEFNRLFNAAAAEFAR